MKTAPFINTGKEIFAERLSGDALSQVDKALKKHGLQIVFHNSGINEDIFTIEKMDYKHYQAKAWIGSGGTEKKVWFTAKYKLEEGYAIGTIYQEEEAIRKFKTPITFTAPLEEYGEFTTLVCAEPKYIKATFQHKDPIKKLRK